MTSASGRRSGRQRVLVAPDKFAGTLTARQAAEAIAEGWRNGVADAVLDVGAMADGGPGFLDAVCAGVGGTVVEVPTTGPLGQPVVASLLLVVEAEGVSGYVEAAQVCGLAVSDERRPWEATTAGLAAVLQAATASGTDRVVVGVGGTATTDGGRGLVEALPSWPEDVDLVVATDVASPLLGPDGAARGFAQQKGADQPMVDRLEQRLAEWAEVTGGDPTAPGAGAGGGLGYGLALLGGRRVSGARLVADALGLEERVAAADVVVTGEGRFDWSSLRGKVVAEVAGRAAAAERPCLVLAGEVLVGHREAAAVGVDQAWSVAELLGSAAAAREHPAQGLSALATQVARTWGHDRPQG